MTPFRIILALLVLAALLLAAGCVTQPVTTAPATGDLTPVSTPSGTQEEPLAEKTTIKPIVVVTKTVTPTPTENKHPDYIKLDAEVYKAGEVVVFQLINRGTGTIRCTTSEPGYTISLLAGNRSSFVVASGGGTLQKITELPPSTSTRRYTLNTVNLTPGMYLVEFDCDTGFAREFVIRENPT